VDCCAGDEYFEIFDRRSAEGDRRRYEGKGPDDTTATLLGFLRDRDVAGASLLDVGGGIGVIDHELLAAGAARAVLVDASGSSVEEAGKIAARRGTAERLTAVRADFAKRAAEFEPADLVTVDRVVCCYPDPVALIGAAANHTQRLLGLVLPRDRWFVRLAIRLENAWFRIRRSSYRAYAHPNALVDRLAAEAGLRPVAEGGTAWWRVVVYERSPAA
jgi:magnesium-protoporphyrin O-methyltransferase